MKKNEIKQLTTRTLYLEGEQDAVIVLEAIKNSYYGTPRYEAIVIIKEGCFKTRVEGYSSTWDLAEKAYIKVKKKLEEHE